MGFEVAPELSGEIGVLCENFGKDIAGAFECRLGVGNRLREVGFRELGGRDRAIGEDGFSQRSKSALAGDFGARPPFRPERQINILKLCLCGGACNLRLKLSGQLALAANCVKNGRASCFEIPQIGKTLLELAELDVVKTAGCLLTV